MKPPAPADLVAHVEEYLDEHEAEPRPDAQDGVVDTALSTTGIEP